MRNDAQTRLEAQLEAQLDLIRPSVVRLRASVLAVTFGAVCGMGLFLATAWLVVRGGEVVGPHLGLLGQYFPGYTVTWGGALLGAMYAAVTGGVLGYAVGWIYNTVALKRAT